MAKTIVQKMVFKNTTPKVLYELYMNPEKHTLIAGAPCKIEDKEGTKFSAHGDYIKGKNLHLIKNKLIVQSWRGLDWEKADIDSTFIINLEPKGNDVELLATHANVPDRHADHLAKGWQDFYWKPWKQHLTGKKITRPAM